jgi:hypothetical protein
MYTEQKQQQINNSNKFEFMPDFKPEILTCLLIAVHVFVILM